MKWSMVTEFLDPTIIPQKGTLAKIQSTIDYYLAQQLPDKDGPAIIGATFDPLYRKGDNVQSVTMLLLDVDHDVTISPAEWCTAHWSDYHHYWWTTSNHRQGASRFRVLLPLLEPIGKPEQVALWRWADERSKHVLDEKCKDPSRLMYLPRKGCVTGTHVAPLLDFAALNLPTIAEVIPLPVARQVLPADEQSALAQTVLDKAVANLSAPQYGQGNSWINKQAFRVGQALHHGMEPAYAQQELERACALGAIHLQTLPNPAGHSTLSDYQDCTYTISRCLEQGPADPFDFSPPQIFDGVRDLVKGWRDEPESNPSYIKFFFCDEQYYLIRGATRTTPGGSLAGEALYGARKWGAAWNRLKANGYPKFNEGKDGKLKLKPRQQIEEEAGEDICSLRYRFSNTPGWTYDEQDEALTVHTAPRTHSAINHTHVHRWLTLLGGSRADHLLSWVAHYSDMESRICALFLIGASNGGKGLLVNGLEHFWQDSEANTVVDTLEWSSLFRRDQFRDADLQLKTPMYFADEQLEGSANAFKRFMTTGSVRPRQMYTKTTAVSLKPRVIAAANNAVDIWDPRKIKASDIPALQDRVGVIVVPEAATDYLDSLSDATVEAMSHHEICEHSLWLRENHEHPADVASSRFAVCGWQSDFFRILPAHVGLNATLLAIISREVLKTHAHGKHDTRQCGVIWGSITTEALGARARRTPASTKGLTGAPEVWVKWEALRDMFWESEREQLSIKDGSQALESISVGGAAKRMRVSGGQPRYFRIKGHLLLRHLESVGGDVEAMTEAMEGV